MDEEDNPLWKGLDARTERLEHLVQELNDIVQGNRYRKIIGMATDQDRMDLELRKINAVLFQDPTGQKGLLHDVDVLMGRRKYDNQSREIIWKSATEVVVKILALVGVLLLSWDKLEVLYHKIRNQKPAPLEAQIEKAKHPKGKTLYKVRHLQEKALSGDTEESPPNPLK